MGLATGQDYGKLSQSLRMSSDSHVASNWWWWDHLQGLYIAHSAFSPDIIPTSWRRRTTTCFCCSQLFPLQVLTLSQPTCSFAHCSSPRLNLCSSSFPNHYAPLVRMRQFSMSSSIHRASKYLTPDLTQLSFTRNNSPTSNPCTLAPFFSDTSI